MTVEERFWGKVEKAEGGCWLWRGGCQRGYPMFWNGEATVRATTWLLGPLPVGFQRHHICKTTTCVRPDHLRVVTTSEHRRIHADEKTHCPHGHPYSGANLYLVPRRDRPADRICRECAREATRRWRRRKETA